MDTLIALRSSLPPRLELFTAMPAFNGGIGEMQTAVTISSENPWGLEAHELPFDTSNIQVSALAFNFTADEILPNLSIEEAKRLIADFYSLIRAMGSLIVINHGPGANPDIIDLLNGN